MDRKTRVECEKPGDLRAMRLTVYDCPRISGCRTFGDHFLVTDEFKFWQLKIAYGAKEIGDEI